MDLLSQTCCSRHVGFSVEGSGQKVTFLPPNLTPIHISEVRTTRFLCQLACPLSSAWKVWVRFVQQSWRNCRWRTSAGYRSKGGYKLANVSRARLGRFLCGFHRPVQNLSGQNKTALLFFKNSSFGRHVACSVGGSRQKVTFCTQPDPLQILEVWPRVFYSSSSAVSVESLVEIWFGWNWR